jgi:hypothetical protein
VRKNNEFTKIYYGWFTTQHPCGTSLLCSAWWISLGFLRSVYSDTIYFISR